mmetsp:Transcript_4289/g.9521  ORF Transcript_4289/g.9521 Transcript_4289/m.9521 type:complete len:308 (+) Transcript_4289:324-1247(+)
MVFSKKKWHEGVGWQAFLALYDEAAAELYDDTRLVPTKFGDTQVNIKGDTSKKPIIMLHGISSCSIMWEWLLEDLPKDYCCVAIDTIGDLGRSYPKDGDPDNGMVSENDAAEWIMEVVDSLPISQPVIMLGYSFGAYLSSCFVRKYPTRVDRQVLMAPACVVAPISKWWLFRAILFGALSSCTPRGGRVEEALGRWFFGTMGCDYDNFKAKMGYPELFEATQRLGAAQTKMQPLELDANALASMNGLCPTLLMIGKKESVIDPKVAVANAKRAEMQVVEYEDAGHIFYCENPRQQSVDDVKAFLSML